MKTLRYRHLVLAAGLALTAGGASAADYVVIPLAASVNAPAPAVWAKIGGFCDIGAWMKTSCVITSGQTGAVGAVRRIADRVDEVMVARTASSYTYAQPKSPIDYHGTVEVRPDGQGRSKILYTLVYDAAALPAGSDKAKDVARRTAMFTHVLDVMKGVAEAK
jgi:hypothetical protein